jgi:hypothetical protein
VLELGYGPEEIEQLRARPALRDAVHWGLLVRRIGPIIAAGRPELPVKRNAEAEKAHHNAQIVRSQAAYDHLLELIAVPLEDEA